MNQNDANNIWAVSRIARLEQPYAKAEHRCTSPPMGCGRPLGRSLATAFRDQASRDEYEINGMCQSCQDAYYDSLLTADDIAAMDADTYRFGRCPDCGRYCEIEHVDVGIGVISGFNCCYLYNDPRPPRCTKTPSCQLGQDHYHKCDDRKVCKL